MPVQPGEHVSTRLPVELQHRISQNGTRPRPAATAKPLPPSQLDTIPQAESQTICDGPFSTAAKLNQVFSLPRLGTNTNKSRNIIPVIPTACDPIAVGSRRKRLVRHPSRRLSSMSIFAQTSSSQHATSTLPRPPSMCMTDIAPKRPANKSSISLAVSFEDETDDESDDTAVHHRKIRQLQMARLAKLTRHLGEEVPPELVLSSTLPTNIADSRSIRGCLSINSSNHHQRWWSLDPTAHSQSASALPSSCKLRKSRSLRDREGVSRLQTYSKHAVNVVDGKLPYALHFPHAEANFPERSQPSDCIATVRCGPDDVDHSLMLTPEVPCGSQTSLHSPPAALLLLTSTPERSQFYVNPVTAELDLDNISNMGHREEKPDRFLGVGINPQSISLTNPSLYEIRHSLEHIPSYPEVNVQINKRISFWRKKFGKGMVQSINPDEVAKQLREMKAST
ncbi:uncharacterized protein EDB93DRAFT_467859 [Suillus bovinus]|uniref:uncharacterized protein n=1 Tax=Suillus bovinus TaxID=48563 RepID=UPI001B861E1A|nr:uncharacterized protein EDB93DRAFT_467859 [Suillus bovinus]KAG2146578.1 hypothetical protein EDB93DRAFT_467859 [Suillus bovinus]